MTQEISYFGKTGYPGFALAKASLFEEPSFVIPDHLISDVDSEIRHLRQSLEKAKIDLLNLKEKNSQKDAQEILEAHLLMLEDPEWISGIESRISNQMNAIKSVSETSQEFKSLLESMDDPYMKARAQDIQDLTQRLIKHLSGQDTQKSGLKDTDDFVVIASDLLPSQFLSLDRQRIKALVIENSSQTSHTVILAKTFEIPLVLGSPRLIQKITHGDLVAVNALKAEIIVSPNQETQSRFANLLKEQALQKEDQKKWIKKRSTSLDGISFEVASNLSSLVDAEIAVQKGSEGCGLFRSEFLLMQKNHWPSENEQFDVYSELAKRMNPHRTVIRLFDVGGDKSLPYFKLPEEENPFLGLRGYRLLQKHPQLLKDQIRAVLRAAEHGTISLMAPMMTNVEEVFDFKSQVATCLDELKSQGLLTKEPNLEIGIMVEVPSIIMSLSQIANEIDFISVGTNDLIQYLCATDRMNSTVAHLHDAYNPAVLRFLKLMADQVQPQIKSGKLWMGMCGELAALESHIPLLMALGFQELSVSPGALLRTRQIVCETSVKDSLQTLEKSLKAKSSNELKQCLNVPTN